jgi:hypothetical protein
MGSLSLLALASSCGSRRYAVDLAKAADVLDCSMVTYAARSCWERICGVEEVRVVRVVQGLRVLGKLG